MLWTKQLKNLVSHSEAFDHVNTILSLEYWNLSVSRNQWFFSLQRNILDHFLHSGKQILFSNNFIKFILSLQVVQAFLNHGSDNTSFTIATWIWELLRNHLLSLDFRFGQWLFAASDKPDFLCVIFSMKRLSEY